ncbi:ABC transporter ATP-binding protein [Glycomyces sp. YM15]|uniref:ABC transporter ATP-binding protein n=1 Tax=Glycomyces sp. YM15 TaxID=2800446 RepID=UPI0019659301|nr:ABC transporter ATP-binding protein [Glycomyces sp. YM15]
MVSRNAMERSGPTATAAITCTGLTKDYGNGHGVFDLDLTIAQGEVFGFIGPNGAGKTTAIRLLMDLIRPSSGTATLLGLDSRRDSLAVKRRVGYLPGELVQFPGVSAGYLIGLLAGIRGGVDPARITSLAEQLDVDLGRRYEGLSHGNKQKVGLIQAFMHRPELIILDEPTLGLDPLIQREFRQLIAESVADGATVFLSSHVLSEVELVCDRIGLIRAGRLERVGSLNELRPLRTHRIEAVFAGRLSESDLANVPGVTGPTIDDHRLTCSVSGTVAPLLRLLQDADVVELDSHELSLEEVFLGEFAAPTGPTADH